MDEKRTDIALSRGTRIAARLFLIVAALTYGGFGLAFLISPAAMASGIDLALGSPVALTDVRATYGGLELGLGVFVAICAVVPRLLFAGLLATTLTVAGFGVGRMAGLVLDAPHGMLHPGFFALELTAAVLGIALLLRVRPRLRA